MEVYVRLHSRRELVAIHVPKGSRCGDILRIFNENGDYYIQQNGYAKSLQDELRPEETVDIVGSLRGGKGGFGSMLRAIGAQIEKTTNREACRDLTGRRLRAINDERRVRHYARRKARKEQEREERRRKKLETLATSVPRHEFDDQEYINERSRIPDRVEKALEEALSSGEPGPSQKKPRYVPPKNMKGAWLDELEFEMQMAEKSADKSESDDGCDSRQKASPKRKSTSCDTHFTQAPVDDNAGVSNLKMESTGNNIALNEEHAVAAGSSIDCVATGSSSDQSSTGPQQPAQTTPEEEAKTKPAAETDPLDLSSVSSADELASKFSADALKAELNRRGVKCGGTSTERAERLWAVKDLGSDDIPRKLRAKK